MGWGAGGGNGTLGSSRLGARSPMLWLGGWGGGVRGLGGGWGGGRGKSPGVGGVGGVGGGKAPGLGGKPHCPNNCSRSVLRWGGDHRFRYI